MLHSRVRNFCTFLIITCLLTAVPMQQSNAKVGKPDGVLALILIRDALAALNQANWTGNYTVLRDYSSPSFAKANDPVRLTSIFQPIRAQALDLAPVLVLNPKMSFAGMIQKGKQLRLTGHFPSRPKQIHFDLIFEPIATRWRLFGISVWAKDAKAVAKVKQTAPAQQKVVKSKPTVKATKSKEGTKKNKASMNHSVRIRVQSQLNKLGYKVGDPDGFLGAKSVEGIKKYQAKMGHKQSGKLTSAELKSLLAIK